MKYKECDSFTPIDGLKVHRLDVAKSDILELLNAYPPLVPKEIHRIVLDTHNVNIKLDAFRKYVRSRFNRHSYVDKIEKHEAEIVELYKSGVMHAEIVRTLKTKHGKAASYSKNQVTNIIKKNGLIKREGARFAKEMNVNPVLSKKWTSEGMAA